MPSSFRSSTENNAQTTVEMSKLEKQEDILSFQSAIAQARSEGRGDAIARHVSSTMGATHKIRARVSEAANTIGLSSWSCAAQPDRDDDDDDSDDDDDNTGNETRSSDGEGSYEVHWGEFSELEVKNVPTLYQGEASFKVSGVYQKVNVGADRWSLRESEAESAAVRVWRKKHVESGKDVRLHQVPDPEMDDENLWWYITGDILEDDRTNMESPVLLQSAVSDDYSNNMLVKVFSDGSSQMIQMGEWVPGLYKGAEIGITPAITVLPKVEDDELLPEDDIEGAKDSLLHVASLRHYFDVYEEKNNQKHGSRGSRGSRGDEDEDAARSKMSSHAYMRLADKGCDLVQRFAMQRHVHKEGTGECYAWIIKWLHRTVSTSQ